MDKEIKKAINAASGQAADRAAQQAVEAIKPYFDEKVQEVRSHFDVTKEQIISEIKAIGEGHKGNAERLDNHDKRIERIEDTVGLPTLEPIIEG